MKQLPTCIFMGDSHLLEKQPICRTDDFLLAQQKSVLFIKKLQKKFDIPIIHGGDLFDKAKVNPELESWAIENLPDGIIAIPGNHDLVSHSLKLIKKTSINVLRAAEKIKLYDCHTAFNIDYGVTIHTYPFSSEIKPLADEYRGITGVRNIALCHQFTYLGKSWPGNTATNAKQLLRKLTGYDIILISDNHKTFIVEEEGRILLSPGSLMRMDADQEDHKPCVFLYYAKDNRIEPVYIPIKDGVISRDHLIKKQEKDKRIQAFVEKVRNQKGLGLNFKKNLEKYFQGNITEKPIEELVMWSLEKNDAC